MEKELDTFTAKTLLLDAIKAVELADSVLIDTYIDKYTNADLITAKSLLKDVFKLLDEEDHKLYF